MEWFTKDKDTKSEADVTISLVKNKGTLSRVSVVFRNNCDKAITEDYAKIGVRSNRLYFSSATKKEGYKLTCKGEYKNKYLVVTNAKLSEWVKDKIGDYNLMYDKDEKLYYIEKPYIAWTEKGYHV